MIISLIAAIGPNRELGLNNHLPWKITGELANFRKTTSGGTLLMGRKTYESLPSPLPNRRHLVVTSHQLAPHQDVDFWPSVQAGIAWAERQGIPELFICGGAKIYEVALPLAHRFYLSKVAYHGPADVYFPPFDQWNWQVSDTEAFPAVNGELAWERSILEK